jgi:hypothetical protein
MKTTLTVLLLIVVFAACTTTQVYLPSQSNVNKREPATLTELQQGHDLYTSKCHKCHGLKNPEKFSAEQWTKILEKMGPKAKLNKDQVSLVYKYVVNF